MELGGRDLEKLAPRPEPGDGQRGLHAGREDELQPGGRVVQEEGHRLVHLRARDDVVVLDDQHEVVLEGVEVVDQDRQDVVDQADPRGSQDRLGVCSEGRREHLEGLDHVEEEADRVVVRAVEGEPGEGSRLLRGQ